MDLNSALQVCPEPKMKCDETTMCFEIYRCYDSWRRRRFSGWFSCGCWTYHDTRKIVDCCKYVCDNIDEPTAGTVENIGSEVL